MPRSRKILTAVLAAILVIGMLPLGPLSGLFSDNYSFKVSAEESVEEEPLIVVGTIGDPHADYGLENEEPYIRTSYITAMNALKAEGIDLLLVGGDMTSDNESGSTNGVQNPFRWDYDVYERTISQYHKYSAAASTTGVTLWACGNHDYEVGRYNDNAAIVTDGDFDSYQGFIDMMIDDCGAPISVYTQDDDPYYGGDYHYNQFPGYWLGAHFNVKGFDFIVINAPYQRSTFYSAGVLEWLDQTLAKIGADKTVFITGHYPLYDNRGLHSLADGIKGNNYVNFVNVLNKYDNAIYLYGHEHGGRSTSQLCDTIYASVDSFERITHYDENGKPVASRGINPTSFITAFMGSASFYNYSLDPHWLEASDPEIIQAMTISVYKNRIEFKVINCGEQTGQLAEPFVWTIKRDMLNTGDVVIPESPETWDLPMNWSVGTERDDNGWDIPVIGNWSISGFKNLDTATSNYRKSTKTTEQLWDAGGNVTEGPQPYLGNNYNETIVQAGKNDENPVVANGTNGWYIANSYRWGSTVARAGGPYIKLIADKGIKGAVYFTAPSDGYYSYTELIKSAGIKNAAEYKATVRLNGLILDSFVAAENGLTKEFNGTVALKKGDLLMFAFEQTTAVDFSNDADAHCFDVLYANVTKISDATVDLLPMNWGAEEGMERVNGWPIAKRGNWRLASFSDPSNITTIRERDPLGAFSSTNNGEKGNSPYPWMNAKENRGSTGDEWYVNAKWKWSGITTFDDGDNKTYMGVVPNNNAHSSNPTVVFTAPADGLYYYSEMFTTGSFYIDVNGDKVDGADELFTVDGTDIKVTATVRKNGVVLDSFVPTTENPSAHLEGTVALKKGELLMFSFTLNTNTAIGNHDHVIKLGQTYVAAIGEYPANYKGEINLDPIFSKPETLTDDLGLVQLLGYKLNGDVHGASNLYDVSAAGKKLEVRYSETGYWAIIDPYGKNGDDWNKVVDGYNLLWAGSTETGIVSQVGGAQLTKDTGSAMVFTVPENGIYTFDVDLGTYWMYAGTNNVNKRYHDYKIMKGDGEILFSTDNVDKGNKYVTDMSIRLKLEKGEVIIFTKTPNAQSTQMNASCNGSASIKITQVDHICTANTLYKMTEGVPSDCVNAGTLDYYTCICGAIYGDAEAKTALTSLVDPADGHSHEGTYTPVSNDSHRFDRDCCDYEDRTFPHDYVQGFCATCNYTCKHVWKNGACTECGSTCAHTGGTATCEKGAICTICNAEYTAKDPENHIGNMYVETNGDGTHDWICHGCNVVVGPNEKCSYENDVCYKCHYNRAPAVEEAKKDAFDALNNFLDKGDIEIEVNGPSEDALNGDKLENVYQDVNGFEYAHFNLRFENNVIILRHHFVTEGAQITVTANGNFIEVTKHSDNVYYFETTYEIGAIHIPVDFTVTDGNESADYSVSVYSYIAVALDKTEDVNLIQALRALYDVNEAAK